MNTPHDQPSNIKTPLPQVAADYVSPHYVWTRTGPTTLRISVIDDEHFTSWTVAPDIMGRWNLNDTGGVPLDLVRTNYTRTPYPDPGRAIDAAQELADKLLGIWDQEIESRIVDKRTALLNTELAFRGISTEIKENP